MFLSFVFIFLIGLKTEKTKNLKVKNYIFLFPNPICPIDLFKIFGFFFIFAFFLIRSLVLQFCVRTSLVIELDIIVNGFIKILLSKTKAAFKVMQCTVKFLRRIPSIKSTDYRFLLCVKFLLLCRNRVLHVPPPKNSASRLSESSLGSPRQQRSSMVK